MKRPKLHTCILIGMGVGLALGLILHAYSRSHPESAGLETTLWWLNLLGRDLFIGALKMIIVPLIFASIIAGICSLPGTRELGSVGWKTLAYYVATTAIAVAIGLTAVLIMRPGHKASSERLREEREARYASYASIYSAEKGITDPLAPANAAAFLEYIARHEGETLSESDFRSKWARIQAARERGPGEMFRQDVLRPILSNPVAAMANMNSLGIIFFAILVGLACVSVGERARAVGDFFTSFNAVMMKITMWVMQAAPLAVGCIIAAIVARLGVSALVSLGWYCATVIVGIAVHVGVLMAIVAFLGKMSPLRFLRGLRSAWLIAFTSTSSAATLPVTMKCVKDELGVRPEIAGFSLPVGATVNMDGTALYEGVAVIFLIQIFGTMPDVGITLTPMTTFIIFITAVLASVGAAAVPSAGLVTMAIVAGAVGLPLHYIVIIYSVDHLLDMFRTSTNVMGDAVGAVVVDRWTRSTDRQSGTEM